MGSRIYVKSAFEYYLQSFGKNQWLLILDYQISKISQVLCSSLHGPKVGKYFWNALTFPSSVPWRGFSKSPTPFPSSSWGERLLLLLGLANSQIIKNGIFYIKQFDGSQGVISAFTFGPSCKIQVHEHKSLHRLISVWGSSIGTLTTGLYWILRKT